MSLIILISKTASNNKPPRLVAYQFIGTAKHYLFSVNALPNPQHTWCKVTTCRQKISRELYR